MKSERNWDNNVICMSNSLTHLLLQQVNHLTSLLAHCWLTCWPPCLSSRIANHTTSNTLSSLSILFHTYLFNFNFHQFKIQKDSFGSGTIEDMTTESLICSISTFRILHNYRPDCTCIITFITILFNSARAMSSHGGESIIFSSLPSAVYHWRKHHHHETPHEIPCIMVQSYLSRQIQGEIREGARELNEGIQEINQREIQIENHLIALSNEVTEIWEEIWERFREFFANIRHMQNQNKDKKILKYLNMSKPSGWVR
jgi:hypothetical protein